MLKSEEASEGETDGGDDSDESDELAPQGSSKHDAMMGKPEGKNTTQDADLGDQNKNQTALGKQGGFDHISKTSPANSKPMFHDPRKDTHDDADPNLGRNMAGNQGDNTQHDEMGVDVHKEPRLQSSKMAARNMSSARGLKDSSRSDVKGEMDMPDVVPSHGEDVKDAPGDTGTAVTDRAVQTKFGGLKGARQKLDGFLSKMKRS